MASTPTLSDIRSWPPTCSVPAAGAVLDISRSYSFELAKRGEFPCRVIKVGSRLRVVTSSLIALLEVGEESAATRSA